MSLNRREFLRRVVGASALLITGLVSSWELLQNLPANGANGSGITSANRPPQSTETISQTVTKQETVTVTERTVTASEYVTAPSDQKSAVSSQTSQQTSQVSSST